MKLILASGSKQRKDIFDEIGLKYEIITSIEEEFSKESKPEKYVEDLSKQKANSVEKQMGENAIIIAADTVIYMNGKVYEKPKTKEEAFENIKELSGNVSYAYTGMTIKDMYQNKEITFYDVCEVYLNKVSEEDIKWYVEHEEKLFDVCGYTILGKASLFLNKVNGDHNTLFGISPGKVYEKLKEIGYKLSDFDI